MATLNRIKLICLLIRVTDIVHGNLQRFSNSTLQLGLLGCNLEKFCSVTIDPPLENGSNTSCCAPCSCLPNCWLFGDCCPDVQELNYESPFGNIELKCEGNYMNVRQIYSYSPTAFIIDNLSSAFYKMITQCPFDYTDNKTKKLCEDPFGADFSIHNFSFSDILTVSSLDQFVFKNVHCAACHGIRDVQRWNMLFTSCGDLVNGYNELKDVLENCGIHTTPPKGFGTERSTCLGYNNMVSTCNTGLDYVDEDVEQACRFSGFPTVYKYIIRHIAYLNIFCLLCNVPSITLPLHCDGDGVKSDSVRYTSFFNIDLTKTTTKKSPRVYRCSSDKVYDDIMNICRDLICPFNKKPEYEACVDNGYRWFDAVIAFPLSVSTSDVNIAAIQNSEHLTKIGNSFLNPTGILKTCNSCRYSLFYKGSDELSLIVDLPVLLNSRCKYEYVEASMAPIKSNTVHLRVPLDESLSINATIKMFPIFDMSVNKKLKYGAPCEVGSQFTMNRLFDCPYIVLNETEYCTWVNRDMSHQNKTCILSVDTINSKNTTELVYTNGEANIRICLNSYLPRFFNSADRTLFIPCLNTFVTCAVILQYNLPYPTSFGTN